MKTKFFIVALILSALNESMASDPDILSDFIVPTSNTTVDGSFFTYTAMQALFGAPLATTFNVFKATMAEFPALNGQSVSYEVLDFSLGSLNPPHMHPRASELLFLIGGTLEVGFVDTTNKLFIQTLQLGDMFVFPKGLVHFQYNGGRKSEALVFYVYGSANAGTVSVPDSVFNTSIDDGALALSFKTDVYTIQKIKSGFAGN